VPLETILKTQNLRKTYKKGTVEVHAVQNVSFEVRKGEFVSIVGRSGSGKSTLLNLIGGLDKASSGNIIVNKQNLLDMSRSDLAMHRRKTVGMIFQSFNLIPSRTALENITLALTFGGIPRGKRKKQGFEILASLGLKERSDHTPGELSGGEAQRVAIARALANDPAILLADEPTGNLDSKTSGEIIRLLHKLNQDKGVTVLMVTHDESSAKTVSHRIIKLLDGKIIEEKRIKE
jgi:putative ABC transport system ATP-binding protein